MIAKFIGRSSASGSSAGREERPLRVPTGVDGEDVGAKLHTEPEAPSSCKRITGKDGHSSEDAQAIRELKSN